MDILANGTLSSVPGIQTSGICCGVKKDGKKDLCIIYSEHKANSAAVFTANKVKSAPVIVNMENIKNINTQAIVVNSGNANSCTGAAGLANARNMAATAAGCLNLSSQEVLVASTGALATPLPMDAIIPGIKKACDALTVNNGYDSAEAILSTDTCSKTIAVQFGIDGKKITMAGMAKGSTMIHPNMGTMLAFIVTDANISKDLLQKALKKSVAISFNMISIDGDTSTSDMAIVLANGCARHNLINSEDERYLEFSRCLNFVCIELAKMIARDGEGSSKFIEVTVSNASNLSEARKAAKDIVASNLVKCEIYGSALKWSTIACVLGYSGINIKPDDYDIIISNDELKVRIVTTACEAIYTKSSFDSILSGNYISITIDLKLGNNSATAWGCDLSCEYVKANAYLN